MDNHSLHDCEFKLTSKTLDSLYPPHLKFSKLGRRFREFFLISEKNCRRCYTPMGISGYVYEKERQLNQHPLTIHPYSEFRHWWEILMITEIFLSLLIRPFLAAQFTWEVCLRTDVQLAIGVADLIQMIDLALNFITGYIDKETQIVVFEFRKIFFHQVKQLPFYYKVIASFPYDFSLYLYSIVNGYPHPIFLFTVFLKAFKLIILNKYCRHIAKIYNWSELRLTLMWVLINMIPIYQLLINFLYLGIFSEEFRTEKANEFIYSEGVFYRHMFAVHVVCNPFFYEIGFHSAIELQSVKDMIVFVSVLFVSNFLTVVIVATIVNLLGLWKTSRIQYSELIQEVRKFLSQENLPKHLHVKVDKYFQFRFQKMYFREKRILETLSPPLRKEVAKFLCIDLLLNPESIFSSIPRDLAVALCQELTFEVFLPGDDIIRAGNKARKLYFLYSGSVAVYTPAEKEMYHLHEGHQFGLSAFLPNNTYAVTIVALEMCECYILLYTDFIKCSAIYPDHSNEVIKGASKRRKNLRKLYGEQGGINVFPT